MVIYWYIAVLLILKGLLVLKEPNTDNNNLSICFKILDGMALTESLSNRLTHIYVQASFRYFTSGWKS